MSQNLLINYPQPLRVSYLTVLASVASANHDNSEEEIIFMQQICALSEVGEAGIREVEAAMKQADQARLKTHLTALKESDLKFSLMADMINLAYADGNIDAQETAQIKKLNTLLGLTDDQFSTISKYVEEANHEVEAQEGNPAMLGLAGGGNPLNFLAKSGLADMFKKSNIPTNNFESGSTIGTLLTGLATSFITSQVAQKLSPQQQQPAAQGGGGFDLGKLAGAFMGGGQQGRPQQPAGGGLDLGSLAGAFLGSMQNRQAPQPQQQQQPQGQPQGNALGNMLQGMLNSPQGQQAVAGMLSKVIGTTKQGNGMGNLTQIIGGGKPKQNNLGSLIGSLLG